MEKDLRIQKTMLRAAGQVWSFILLFLYFTFSVSDAVVSNKPFSTRKLYLCASSIQGTFVLLQLLYFLLFVVQPYH